MNNGYVVETQDNAIKPDATENLVIQAKSITVKDGSIQIELYEPSYDKLLDLGLKRIKVNDAVFELKEKQGAGHDKKSLDALSFVEDRINVLKEDLSVEKDKAKKIFTEAELSNYENIKELLLE